MANAEPITFTRLTDGTLLQRQADGAFRPVASETDHAKLAALTDAEIERMATTDPDHPALDDAFWAGVSTPASEKEAISIKLDHDVLRYFRREGRGYQTRMNAVLRHYMEAQQAKKAGG